nr:hypothetical protein [Arthrospira sp. SH-MAG29]
MQKLSFLESLVESGKYPSAEDAIAEGICSELFISCGVSPTD